MRHSMIKDAGPTSSAGFDKMGVAGQLFDPPANSLLTLGSDDPRHKLIMYSSDRLGRKDRHQQPRITIYPTGVFHITASLGKQLGIVDYHEDRLLFCLDKETNHWYFTVRNDGLPIYRYPSRSGIGIASSALRSNILESISMLTERINPEDRFYMRVSTDACGFAAYGDKRFYHAEVIM